MGELLDKLVITAPATVAVIILVIIFIKHIDKRDLFHRQEMGEHREVLKEIHASCHNFQNVMQAEQKIMARNLENALDHNTRELQRNTNFLAKVTKVNGEND
jgi:hypothetical protein